MSGTLKRTQTTNALGEFLSKHRWTRNLRHQDLADAIGSSLKGYYNYEAGIVPDMPLSKFVLLAKFYKIRPGTLLRDFVAFKKKYDAERTKEKPNES